MIKLFAKNYLDELKNICDNMPLNKLEQIADDLVNAYKNRENIYIMGNGGSASTASHMSSDLNKGCSYNRENRFRVICLNDNIPTMLAYANDVSYDDIFVEQLKNFLSREDLVIGISGSGNSDNVIKAIQYAKEIKAKTIGITGFDGGKLAKISSISLIVPSNDMQKVEDMHLVIEHMIMKYISSNLENF